MFRNVRLFSLIIGMSVLGCHRDNGTPDTIGSPNPVEATGNTGSMATGGRPQPGTAGASQTPDPSGGAHGATGSTPGEATGAQDTPGTGDTGPAGAERMSTDAGVTGGSQGSGTGSGRRGSGRGTGSTRGSGSGGGSGSTGSGSGSGR
jgi:hypothetical protein